MKKLNKILSVGLSLVMCAGMVAPAFAASFADLQSAIDGTEGVEMENGHTGYGSTMDDGRYEIEAWTENDTRNVQLNEDVVREENESAITVSGKGTTVVMDIGDKKIDGDDQENSSVIKVSDGADLTINAGDKGTITGGNQTVVKNKGDKFAGGGVDVHDAKFTMNGGNISDNSAFRGGGLYAGEDSEVKLNDVDVSNNNAQKAGGGVFCNGSDVTVTGGTFSHNNCDTYSNGGGAVRVYGTDEKDLPANTPSKGYVHLNGVRFDGNTSEGKKENSGTIWATDFGEITVEGNNVIVLDGKDNPVFQTQKSININTANNGRFSGTGTFNGFKVDPVTGKLSGEDGDYNDQPSINNPDQTSGGDVTIPDTNIPLGEEPDQTEIDDQAIPLASGPVTRAQFIDYLWRHEGEPEGAACTFADVAEDHEYVLALGWAQANGIAEADADGNFQPDELVTVAAVREFLGNFANVFGSNAVNVADLTTLTGADDEAVLNCDQVLAEFFGEEYAPAEDSDIEIAA